MGLDTHHTKCTTTHGESKGAAGCYWGGQICSPVPTTIHIGSSKYTAAWSTGPVNWLGGNINHQNKQNMLKNIGKKKCFPIVDCTRVEWECTIGKTSSQSRTALFKANPLLWGKVNLKLKHLWVRRTQAEWKWKSAGRKQKCWNKQVRWLNHISRRKKRRPESELFCQHN